MHLTQQTDYALRVMMYAAIHHDRMINIHEIAQAYQISRSHLMKIVALLVKGGFLHSTRGKGGGLALVRSSRHITVGAIVRYLEQMNIVECMSDASGCGIAAHCQLYHVLREATEKFLAHLDGASLADLLNAGVVGALYGPPGGGTLGQAPERRVALLPRSSPAAEGP